MQTAAGEARRPRPGTRPRERTEWRQPRRPWARSPGGAATTQRGREEAHQGRDPTRAELRRKPPQRRAQHRTREPEGAAGGPRSGEKRQRPPGASAAKGRSPCAAANRAEGRPTEERTRRNTPGTPDRERKATRAGRIQPRTANARGKALVAPTASAERAAGPDGSPCPTRFNQFPLGPIACDRRRKRGGRTPGGGRGGEKGERAEREQTYRGRAEKRHAEPLLLLPTQWAAKRSGATDERTRVQGEQRDRRSERSDERTRVQGEQRDRRGRRKPPRPWRAAGAQRSQTARPARPQARNLARASRDRGRAGAGSGGETRASQREKPRTPTRREGDERPQPRRPRKRGQKPPPQRRPPMQTAAGERRSARQGTRPRECITSTTVQHGSSWTSVESWRR